MIVDTSKAYDFKSYNNISVKDIKKGDNLVIITRYGKVLIKIDFVLHEKNCSRFYYRGDLMFLETGLCFYETESTFNYYFNRIKRIFI